MKRLTFNDYQQIPRWNISTVLHLLTSPKQCKHQRDNPPAESMAMRIGKACHTAVLEPLQFLEEYVMRPSHFTDWRTKAARQWREQQEQAGKVVLTAEEYEVAKAVAGSVQSHPVAGQMLSQGQRELTWEWDDPITGIPCKGRTDWWNDSAALLVDLKTTRHPTPRAFGRDAARLNIHVRMAWYADGIKAVTGMVRPPRPHLIAVQNTEPFDCVVYEIPPDAIDAGRRVYQGLMETLAECLETGEWPGVSEDEKVILELPAWALVQDDEEAGADTTLVVGGERMAV